MFSAAHFLDIFKRKVQLGLFDRVRERERLLNEHDGDPYATIAQLLKSMAELKREIKNSGKTSRNSQKDRNLRSS